MGRRAASKSTIEAGLCPSKRVQSASPLQPMRYLNNPTDLTIPFQNTIIPKWSPGKPTAGFLPNNVSLGRELCPGSPSL